MGQYIRCSGEGLQHLLNVESEIFANNYRVHSSDGKCAKTIESRYEWLKTTRLLGAVELAPLNNLMRTLDLRLNSYCHVQSLCPMH